MTTPRRTVITLPQLHPGQQEVADSAARFLVLAAGRRWGKTVLRTLHRLGVAWHWALVWLGTWRLFPGVAT